MKRDKFREQDVIISAILTTIFTVIYLLIRFSKLHPITHTRGALSPAFFPEMAFILLIILSVILFISSLVRRREQDNAEMTEKLDRTQIRQVGLIMLIMVVYIHLINFLGYYISSLSTIVTVMLLLKVKGWYKILLISMALMVTVFLFFEKGLRILLPRGFLF